LYSRVAAALVLLIGPSTVEFHPARLFVAAAALVLAGCASYHPQALDTGGTARPDLAHVRVDAASLPFAALSSHRFDPSDGFDETELATLAVVNNPDLKLARDDAAIAHAQAFAAGLLPDPQLVASGDVSTPGEAGATRAFSLGLNYDITPLILRASSMGAANGEARKADLTLLWQEWQVVSQARLLFVKLVHQRRLAVVLEDNRTLFADRAERMRLAQQRGLLASDAVLPNLAALQDVERQLFELRRQMAQNMRDLDALLGLDPATELRLQDAPAGAFDAPTDVAAALASLARRRPDLLALAAGYDAQDQRYRGAILAQFPALNVGLSRSRDNSNVYSKSVGVTVSLPFLNRNRGNIAIEKVTRQKLFDEYQARLMAARDQIQGLQRQRQIDEAQLAQVKSAVAELSGVLERSSLARSASNIDLLAYANARAALLAKQVEQVNLEQQLAEQRVALQTLLGVEARAPISTGPSLE
jgi:outer membrane protein TolC